MGPGSQSWDRFLDPGLGPGLTSEKRDGIDFRLGFRFFFLIKSDLFFEFIFQFHEKTVTKVLKGYVF